MKLKSKYHKQSPDIRLYHLDIPIIGLTGGIATGKSTVARILRKSGLEVIDADQLVKEIYQLPETVHYITQNYPEVIQDSEINFPKLRKLFFNNSKVKEDVERLIYQSLPGQFLKAVSHLKNKDCIIYDVPLLYEKAIHQKTDLNVVVYAPYEIQKARLMVRDGQLETMAEKILLQQMDIEEKKLKADFVINNSGTLEELAAEVSQFLHQVFE